MVEDQQSDLELLEAWGAGDRASGSRLFRRYVAAVSRFFRSKVPEAAEDLTQKTFLALVEARSRFRSDASFRSFVYGVARNQLLMHLRGQRRARQRFDPLTWSAVDAGASPARVAARGEQSQLVLAALQRLPVDYQIALELHYFEAMSVAEIAATTGDPTGTIKSRLARGRALLREAIESLADRSELLSSAIGELDLWLTTLPAAIRGPRDDERS